MALVILMTASAIAIRPTRAGQLGLTLPSMPVTIEVFNGTESYFETAVMNVPLGYDVSDATYQGWCVDLRHAMERSPATHEVALFSSYSPPSSLADQKWDVINYIINHKEGSAEDVQQAIWYFVNMVGNYTPSNIAALLMINSANAKGIGYVPAIGDKIAVICFADNSNTQVSVIEARCTATIPEFPSFMLLTLFMMASFLAAAFCKYRNRRNQLKT